MAQKKQQAKQQEPAKQSSGKSDAGKQPNKLEKAGAPKEKQEAQNLPQKSRGCLLKLIIVVILLALLTGAIFSVASYLGFIDVQNIKKEIGQRYELHKYPVIGRYFPEEFNSDSETGVDTNFETVPLEEEPPSQKGKEPSPAVLPSAEQQRKDNVLTLEDIAKEEQKKQTEAAKRISRTARLYGEMKPKDAAAVMKDLDDKTVLVIFSKMEDSQVSKILALFDAERAARLTEDMLKGQ